MERVTVELAGRSYDILIQPGMLASGDAAQALAAFAAGAQICLVTHPRLRALYGSTLLGHLSGAGARAHCTELLSGERFKTLRSVQRLYRAFLDARLDRSALVAVLGGGVLGDVAGFAAATYLRGVRLVQIPSTLLAQVDAAIGGKTGVDLPDGKNLVGAFHQPAGVIIDPTVLVSLPRRELRAGLAEMIKYGIISDRCLFADLLASMPRLLKCDLETLTPAIARSCAIKAEVVSGDEREQGRRAILNFGHTIGHALEAVTGYRRFLHGEAVAIGMVAAGFIGLEAGITPPSVIDGLREMLLRAGLPVQLPQDVSAGSLLEAARLDKKVRAGQIRFVLVTSIGDVCVAAVPEDAVMAGLQRFRT